MKRHIGADIIQELAGLMDDICDEIKHQLSYYRASVYKQETRTVIDRKISGLRMVAGILGRDFLIEPFRDFDAMAAQGGANCAPGECPLSSRVTILIGTLQEQMQVLMQNQPASAQPGSMKELTKNLHAHRRELLKMCRQGSRHWSLFQSL